MQFLTITAKYSLDLLGIFAFALSGAFLGVRKDFDLFGTVVVAEAAGLGGGVLRDLILDVPPIAFTDPGYPLAPVAAALLAYFGKPLQRRPYWFDLLDAVALGLFSVTGTIKALQYGMAAAPSAALGVGTAVGGGVVASVLAKELPPLMRWDADLYAIPAITGAGSVSVLHTARALDVTTATCAALAAYVFRLLALHFHWRIPRSSTWRTPQTRQNRRARPPRSDALPPPRSLSPVQPSDDTLRLRIVGEMPGGRKKVRLPQPDHTLQLQTTTTPRRGPVSSGRRPPYPGPQSGESGSAGQGPRLIG